MMGAPEFQRGAWPDLILPKLARVLRHGNGSSTQNGGQQYWLLSLYSPSRDDRVEWSEGDYQLIIRGGYVENSTASRAQKKAARLIAEGSVIAAASEPRGVAVDVAPEGFTHAVYRSGIALALKLPIGPQNEPSIVEDPSAIEEIEPIPCEEPAPALPLAESVLESSIPEDSIEDRGGSQREESSDEI